MDLNRLLLSLGVAVMMCTCVKSENWAVVCLNNSVVKSFNFSTTYNISDLVGCFTPEMMTNYTCDYTNNTTGLYNYTCYLTMIFSQAWRCFPNVNQSYECVTNILVTNNAYIQCKKTFVNLQLLSLDIADACHKNVSFYDNDTANENVTSYVNRTPPMESQMPTTIMIASLPNESITTSEDVDDDKLKIILGVTLPIIFIISAVFLLICLHRTYNLTKIFQNFRGKHRKRIPKAHETKEVETQDLSQYSSLNPVHYLAGQDTYTYANVTPGKGGAPTLASTNDHTVHNHPAISNEFSTKSYEYVSGIVGQIEGHLGKEDGREAISNGSTRSDYSYELVTKATAGREQPNSTISCIYANTPNKETVYNNERK